MLYTVLDTIDHNGERFTVGDEVDLSPAAAKILILLGVVSAKKPALGKDQKSEKGKETSKIT